MDWYWARNSIEYRLPSVKKIKHSSSTRRITWRGRWSDRILETERLSSERFWELSALVWWNVEEQNARRRRQQEKIFNIVLTRVRTRNSLPPSSSRSFRTQSHWSFITGQCVNSGQFLRVHLSHRLWDQFTIHHKFRIDSGRTNFKQKTDGILYGCGSCGQESPRSKRAWSDQTTSCIVQSKSGRRHQDTVHWVDIQLAQRKGFKFYQTRCNAFILYDRLPAYYAPRKPIRTISGVFGIN